MTPLQLFLLVYLLFYFGTAFFWRSYQTWRATGVNPYRLKTGESLHHMTGLWLRILSLGISGVALIYALFPGLYFYLGPINWLNTMPVTAVGIFLLLISMAWVLLAQAQMGNSWRIGIDDVHETTLVTYGLYGRFRNPIFLGMRGNLLGLFLVIPNALTFAIWILGDVLIQLQVHLEEAYLLKQHGSTYEQYCRHAKRWL